MCNDQTFYGLFMGEQNNTGGGLTAAAPLLFAVKVKL